MRVRYPEIGTMSPGETQQQLQKQTNLSVDPATVTSGAPSRR
jgi:hypothetical protein